MAVSDNGRRTQFACEAIIEQVCIKIEISGVGPQLLDSKRILVRIENIVVLPELILVLRACGRLRCYVRVRMRGEREVTEGETHLTGVDQVLFHVRERIAREITAVRAFEIAKDDHRHRCALIAKHR